MVWALIAFVALISLFVWQFAQDAKISRELAGREIKEVWFCGGGKPVKIYDRDTSD